LRNLKPSQLPVNTVIDVKGIANFFKVDECTWEEVWSGCCSSIGRISDDGRTTPYSTKYGLSTPSKADDVFTDFKVISISIDSEVDDIELHGDFDRTSGSFADGTLAHECKGYNCDA
jgi:hypothetical protein